MKIISSVVLAVMFGASTLFAGDEENAKAVVVKDWQLAAAGEFAECLALRTPDFTEKNDDGPTRNYEQTKWQLTSLDGKHPEEFMFFLMTLNGAKIQAEMMPQIREKASDPKFVQYYKKTCSQLAFVMKEDAAFQLKTLRIVSVVINGDSASVIVEYDRQVEKSAIPMLQTVYLRKNEGEWKISKIVNGINRQRKRQ